MPAKKTTKKVAAKKTATKTPAKKTAAKKAATAPKKTSGSPEAIAKAAYLNYRRRVELGLPGDHDSDWIEAEQSFA